MRKRKQWNYLFRPQQQVDIELKRKKAKTALEQRQEDTEDGVEANSSSSEEHNSLLAGLKNESNHAKPQLEQKQRKPFL